MSSQIVQTLKSWCKWATLLLVVGLLGCRAVGVPKEVGSEVKFYGADNKRYELNFKNHFFMAKTEDAAAIKAEGYRHIKHLFSVFQWHKEFIKFKGIPHRQPNMKILSVTDAASDEFPDGRAMIRVEYEFDDTVVFNHSLPNGPVEFWMPKDQSSFYELGVVDGKNRCTDYRYRSRGDFWYFWDPDKPAEVRKDDDGNDVKEPGCPESFKESLVRVRGNFRSIPNDTGFFPLYGKIGTESKRLIYVAFGVATDFSDGDPGFKAFFAAGKKFEELGFKVSRKLVDLPNGKHWIYETKAEGRDVELHFGLFESNDREFTDFGREALEKSDIFIYAGHSGLGGYLPTRRFMPVTLPKKYQIFMFNGCSSFAYYNESYFDLKKLSTGRSGTLDLEIVTTGLESLFDVNPYVVSNFIDNLVINGKHYLWDNIINDLYWQTSKVTYGSQNQYRLDPAKYSAHFQVNGNEDNPRGLPEAMRP